MKQEKKAEKEKGIVRIFDAGNYKLMIGGGVLILAGILLMIGGKSADPNVFDTKEVYSFQRITLAPILIIAGLVLEIYAIMKNSNK
ncbi:MAG: DUF3098 domain-containing protein [Bacteroidota bacterium]|jgi:hypothetical protein